MEQEGGNILAKYNWVEITREDVIKAIEKFLANNPEYPEPRSTFLVYDGKRLPAKHIRGMAYREHFGVEISKNDFGGGMETVRFFERLGVEMDYRGSSKKSSSIKEEKKIAHSKEKLDGQKLKKEVIDVGKHTNQIKNKETNREKISSIAAKLLKVEIKTASRLLSKAEKLDILKSYGKTKNKVYFRE